MSVNDDAKGTDTTMTKRVKRPSAYAEYAHQLWTRVLEIAEASPSSRAMPMVGDDGIERDGARIEGVDLKAVMIELWGLKPYEVDKVTQQARRAAGIGAAEAVRNLVSGRGDSARAVWWVANEWPSKAIYQPPSVRQATSENDTTETHVASVVAAEPNGPPDLIDDDDDPVDADVPSYDVPLPAVEDLRTSAMTIVDQLGLRYQHDLKMAKEDLELARAENEALRKAGFMAYWTLGEVLGVSESTPEEIPT